MLCASCQGSQPDLSATALQSRFDTLSDYERETSGLNYKVYRSTEKGNPFGTEEDRVADCWKPLAKSATVSEYESGYLHTGMSLDEVVQRMGRPYIPTFRAEPMQMRIWIWYTRCIFCT